MDGMRYHLCGITLSNLILDTLTKPLKTLVGAVRFELTTF